MSVCAHAHAHNNVDTDYSALTKFQCTVINFRIRQGGEEGPKVCVCGDDGGGERQLHLHPS